MSVPATPLTAGTVLTGKTSWFGGPGDPSSGPTTASGKPITGGGIAVYNEATLGGYWRVTFPNGKTSILQQTDIGPAPWTGRLLDVAYSSLGAAGYSEGNFPTDAKVRAEYLGKGSAAAAASSSTPAAAGGSTSSTPSSGSSTGSLGAGGLAPIVVKGLVYLALIGGALTLLWMGAKTFLQPRPKAPA